VALSRIGVMFFRAMFFSRSVSIAYTNYLELGFVECYT